MNRILFEHEEISGDGKRVTLTDHRADHIRKVLHGQAGQVIKTGEINGPCGNSVLTEINEGSVTLSPTHTEEAPEPCVDLLLALPRPKVIKRLWPQLAALGVRRIFLLNAAKVEKCYFSSQWIDPASYRPLLIEGLTQAGTTRLPEVRVCPRLKPFMEDEAPALFRDQDVRLLAHPLPTPSESLPRIPGGKSIPLVAIGPEGGWTPYELALFQGLDFTLFSLGKRILRTDTACIALLSVIDFLRGSGPQKGIY